MNCPNCSYKAVKNGKYALKDGVSIQTYRCKFCSKCFSERSATLKEILNTKHSTAKALNFPEENLMLLHEQVESLKQLLHNEHQITEQYRQELTYANHELNLMNRELTTLSISSLELLKIDKAKKLTKIILRSKKFTSESLAQLLTAIYSFEVKPHELEPAREPRLESIPSKKNETRRLSENYHKIRDEFNELKVRYDEVCHSFISFKAHFVNWKSQRSVAKKTYYTNEFSTELIEKSTLPNTQS